MAANGVVRDHSKSGRSYSTKKLKPGGTYRDSSGQRWKLSKSGRSYSKV